jgi:hypothetical protein
MDHQQELAFIQTFVRRDRRGRAQLELLSPKRRAAFIGRLAHRYADALDMRFCTPVPPPNSDSRAIHALLARKGAPATCYAISSAGGLDGRWLPLAEALRAAVGAGLPSILICREGRLGYFEAEQEQGPPPRFLIERAEHAAGPPT